MSGSSSQSIAPLLAALSHCARRSSAAFHTPGHKRGQGIAQSLRTWLGDSVFQADLPELPELDNLFAPAGVIAEAQQLAAEAFGAEQTWFLANGSTCGIEAAILATCRPGEKLILPRNMHQSAISGLVLSGAAPVFLEPDYDPVWDMAHSLPPAAVAAALAAHPDARAVLLVSPTYYGTCGDVRAIAQIAHQHQVPLLVDAAHGAHFGFHPDLPESALMQGADLVVQSTHKTLSALTQAAMLHIQGDRIDRQRLSRSLQLVQSTSPNYLLLASLDAARRQMALEGKALMAKTLALAMRARMQLSQMLGLKVFEPVVRPGCVGLDCTRITVDATDLGWSGFAADELLHQQGVTAELPALQHLTFIVTLGNSAADLDRLVQAWQQLSDRSPRPVLEATFAPPENPPAGWLYPLPALLPREAFFADSSLLPIEQAIGQISAEAVCPYPPGIPLLLPGEVISPQAVRQLQQILAAGGAMTGSADPTLQRLKVILR